MRASTVEALARLRKRAERDRQAAILAGETTDPWDRILDFIDERLRAVGGV